MVGGQPLFESLCVVIRPLDQRLSGEVVGHGLFWRRELLVIGASRGRMDEASGDTGDEERVLHAELDGVVELL